MEFSRFFQPMLASSQHRPSAASVITSLSVIREEALKNHKKFTGNLLTVENNRKMAIVPMQVNMINSYFSYVFIFNLLPFFKFTHSYFSYNLCYCSILDSEFQLIHYRKRLRNKK